ncbi:MAG TPA: DNA polymerase III subunit epsilon [Methylococcus sp.]|nr:DNA polymerase III subunit epsilon [Methylococcus sp.]
MRQIVLDTETTGLDPQAGHRIIEIGCIELLNRKMTQNRFHVYLNPEREIDAGAAEVHGLNYEFLIDKPRFADIVDDFLAFIRGTELIIHNAAFDVAFLDRELALLADGRGTISDYCAICDTLAIARKNHPGQRNSLDALCRRYGIDNSRRELHGALLDAEILAEVYLAMTGGQMAMSLDADSELATVYTGLESARPNGARRRDRPRLRVIRCSEEELRVHEARLESIAEASFGNCVWKQPS